MSVELKRLIEKISHFEISLLAGQSGINNPVTWVHTIETIESSSFLEQGELVFVTGIGLDENTSLIELIESIYKYSSTGLVINIGPYINEIPNNVIDFCNEHSFPLCVVPWKVRLSEIFKILCYSITKNDERNIQIAAAFKNAIFFPEQEALYTVALSQNNFSTDWTYSICIISIITTDKNYLKRLQSLLSKITLHTSRSYSNFAAFIHKKEIILVTAKFKDNKLHDFIYEIYNYSNGILKANEHLYFSVGNTVSNIKLLHKSYHQAVSMQKFMQNKCYSNPILFYSEMGVYKLLMSIDDEEVIKEYYISSVSQLVEYDEKNGTNLSETLKCYLNHNGSVIQTAEEMYVHRNTINYKLNRIEEILDTDLSNLDVRFALNLGFKIKDII